MKIHFSRPNVNFKGKPREQGTILDVDVPNDQAALLAAGCEIYDPEIHKAEKAPPAKTEEAAPAKTKKAKKK